MLILDNNFTESIDQEIRGKWKRNKDTLYINHNGQYNPEYAVEFNILKLDGHILVLRRGEEGRILYFNRREQAC